MYKPKRNVNTQLKRKKAEEEIKMVQKLFAFLKKSETESKRDNVF